MLGVVCCCYGHRYKTFVRPIYFIAEDHKLDYLGIRIRVSIESWKIHMRIIICEIFYGYNYYTLNHNGLDMLLYFKLLGFYC